MAIPLAATATGAARPSEGGRAANRKKLETAFNAWMLARHAMTMCAGAVSRS
jgi:hypothetical protein